MDLKEIEKKLEEERLKAYELFSKRNNKYIFCPTDGNAALLREAAGYLRGIKTALSIVRGEL